jgi:predicted N-acetyltransferase YhbS
MANLVIRHEEPVDHPAMENLIRDAFWDVYRPGASEHLLIHNLRQHPSYLPEFSFIAELDGRPAGGIWYALCDIEKPDGARIPIPALGPIGVAPAFQKQGIGSALIRHTLPLVKATGHPGIVLFGDPVYYGRFGFTPGLEAGIAACDGNFYDVLQLVRFDASADLAGRFQESEPYQVKQDEVDAFEIWFPPREKHVLPTQLH